MPTYRFEARYPRAGFTAEASAAAREWLRSYEGGDVTRVTRNGPTGTEYLVGFELFSGSLITTNAMLRALSLSGMVIESLWRQRMLVLPEGMSGPDMVQPTCVHLEQRR